MLRLRLHAADRHRLVEMPVTATRLGSAPDNDLVLAFTGVSRHHATAEPTAHGLRLRDLGSKNGLVRDGRKVAELELRPGEEVQIGSVTLGLEEVSTGDGLIALALPVNGPGPDRWTDAETAEALSQGSAAATSASAALRLVRELEDVASDGFAHHRDAVLERAFTTLGARSLVLFHARSRPISDPALLACAGVVPSPEIFAELAQAALAAHDDRAAFVRLRAGSEHALLSRETVLTNPHLAALFPPEHEPAPWQRDLFAYLAARLRQVRGEVPRPEPREIGPLRLPPGMIVGPSPALRNLLRHLAATVQSDSDVLLLGESGTGKEVFAKLIHGSGFTADGPFVDVNCPALPADLLEAELFGIGARVATGVDQRVGRFVQADGGTIFLDEIGDLPLVLQTKLLRVLQEREILPIGSSTPRKIRVRVIAASNRDIPALVERGLFRDDLYYRLRGLQFHLPPLRERSEDLPALVLAIAERTAQKYNRRVQGISPKALALLQRHSWRGNVRELQQEIDRAVLICPDGGVLESTHFAAIEWRLEQAQTGAAATVETAVTSPDTPAPAHSGPSAVGGDDLPSRLAELERESIRQALERSKGNKAEAARQLGIHRATLYLKLRRYKLDQ